jgi:hypothetical protein
MHTEIVPTVPTIQYYLNKILSKTESECIELEEMDLIIPLPFFWETTPLPTAGLPYTNLIIEIELRDLKDLLICQNKVGQNVDIEECIPRLTDVKIHANYAVVSGDERTRLGRTKHKFVINSMEKILEQDYNNFDSNNWINCNIRTDNSVRGLMFGVRNGNNPKEFSNYATNDEKNPISKVVLYYESTQRLYQDSNYFTFLNPFHHAPSIPKDVGYHLYSYATNITGIKTDSEQDFIDAGKIKPGYSVSACGSTNYKKLIDVSMVFEKNKDIQTNETDKLIIYALTHKICSIEGGEMKLL